MAGWPVTSKGHVLAIISRARAVYSSRLALAEGSVEEIQTLFWPQHRRECPPRRRRPPAHKRQGKSYALRIGNSNGLFHYPRRFCPPAACQPPPRARAPRQAAAGRAACRGHGQDDSLGTGRRRCLPGALPAGGVQIR